MLFRSGHAKIVELLRSYKVLTVPAGNEVIRIIPPLIISEEEIDFAIATIKKVLREVNDR